jgi:hypothetical protein
MAFEDTKERLAWAEERFSELKTYFADDELSNPDNFWELRREPPLNGGEGVDIVWRQTRDLPQILHRLVCEIIGHIRASLDYLILEIVEINGETPDPRTCFPFCDKSKDWKNHIKLVSRNVLAVDHPFMEALMAESYWKEKDKITLCSFNTLANAEKHHSSIMAFPRRIDATLILDPGKGLYFARKSLNYEFVGDGQVHFNNLMGDDISSYSLGSQWVFGRSKHTKTVAHDFEGLEIIEVFEKVLSLSKRAVYLAEKHFV